MKKFWLSLLAVVLGMGILCGTALAEDTYYKVAFQAPDAEYGIPYDQDVLAGECAWEPDYEPERSGYAFTGWYLDGSLYDFDAPVTGDITLKAQWVRAYEVYVGGVQITESNKDDVLGDGTVSFDSATNTLTLNNANIQGAQSDGAGIAFYDFSDSPRALNLKLLGDNVVTAFSAPYLQPSAIMGSASLTIEGPGSLTARAAQTEPTYQEGCYGIQLNGYDADLHIKSGTIVAQASNVDRIIYSGGIFVRGNIIIDGGDVTASVNATGTGNVDVSGAIYTEGNYKTITINGGKVTAFSGKGNSVSCGIGAAPECEIIINGGEVNATGGESESCSYGIGVTSGKVTIKGGKVTATGSKANESSYGIGVVGDLTISGDAVVNAAGGSAGKDSFGVGANGDVTITGGKVTAHGGAAQGVSYGIGTEQNLIIRNAAITVEAGSGTLSYGLGAEGDITLGGTSTTIDAQGKTLAAGALGSITSPDAGYRYEVTTVTGESIRTHKVTGWKNPGYRKLVMEPGVWEYTLSFTNTGDSTMEDIVQGYGTAVTAPEDPVREGYTFTGWTDADGNALQVPATMPEGDMQFVAAWERNQYTITFTNTGDSVIDPITSFYGDPVNAPADPVRENYTFTGWNPQIPQTIPAGDMTITAQWEINKHTVTWVDEDGNVIATEEVEHGGKPATEPEVPAKEGHAGQWEEIGEGIDEPTTIKPVYTANGYTVIFADHDGAELKKEVVTYGEAATAPADPEREGYTFTGWDKAFDSITADVTVTAQYTINKYTVTWVDEDGNVIATEEVEHGGKPATEPEVPAKEGHVGQWEEIGEGIDEPTTIKPVYTALRYTLTVSGGSGSGAYAAGEEIAIKADAPAGGMQFKAWTGTEGLTFLLGSDTMAEVTIRMPARDVTITAAYEKIPVPAARPVVVSPTGDKTITVYEGEPAQLTIVAENALTYQWYIDRIDGAGWREIGDDTDAYTSSPTTLDNDGFIYKCVVTGEDGTTADSPVFTLQVLKKADIPQTGDGSMADMWLALCLLSGCGLIALVLRERKKCAE